MPSSLRTHMRTALSFADSAAIMLLVSSLVMLPSSSGTPRSGPVTRLEGASESAELRQAAQRLEVCSATNVAGVGLRGEYFANPQSQGRALLVRIDPTIDFNVDLDWPESEVATRPRSVRWSGWIKPPMAGRFRFHFSVPGGRVYVSRQALVGPTALSDASIELAAGRFYPVRVEGDLVAAGPPDRLVRLEWTAPHGARNVIPRSLLYLPSETTAGAPK